MIEPALSVACWLGWAFLAVALASWGWWTVYHMMS